MLQKIWDYLVNWVLKVSGAADEYNKVYNNCIALKEKCTALETEINFLNNKGIKSDLYKKLNAEIESLKEQLNNEINLKCSAIEKVRELKLYYKDTVSVYELQSAKNDYEKQVRKLQQTITKLQSENEQLKSIPKNPLGAGRKERGTPQEINRILELNEQGLSLGKIVNIMTDETKNNWCKSTVKNILSRTK